MPNDINNDEILSMQIEVSDEEAQKRIDAYLKKLQELGRYSDKYKKTLDSLFGYAGGKLRSSTLSEADVKAYKSILSAVNKAKAGLKDLSNLDEFREKPDLNLFDNDTIKDAQQSINEMAQLRDQTAKAIADDGYDDNWVKRITKDTGAMTKYYETIENGITSIRKDVYDKYKVAQSSTTTEKRKTPTQLAREQERAQKETARQAEKEAREQERAQKETARQAEKEAREQERKRKDIQKTLQKPFTKGVFNKIGSIITYRLTRTVLSAITNGFKQGFQLLKDDNEIVSEVSTKFNQMSTAFSTSMATIVLPILQSLSSALEPISQKFIDLANSISYSTSDTSTYFRISKEKVDAYAESLKNANSQLSQLDKFATLSGTKKVDLGDYVSKEDITNADVQTDIANVDKYQNLIDFIDKVADGVQKLTGFFDDLSIGGIAAIGGIVLAFGTLVGAINPVVTGFIGILGLFTTSSAGLQALSAALVTAAGAMIGLGIAKAFALNPKTGALRGLAAGAAVASGIAAITRNFNSGTGALNSVGTTSSISTLIGSSSSDLAKTVTTAEQKTTGGSGQVQGDVYLDGEKVGKIMTPKVYRNGVRSGYFSAK